MSAEVREKIIALSLKHPAWGQARLSDQLRLEGILVSPSTILNIWVKEDLVTRYKRLLRLEEEKNGQDIELTEEQMRFLEKANPCFWEGKVQSPYPGYLLSQDTFPIVRRKDEEKYGEYRTKRVILEIYDEMAEAIRTGKPYQNRLDPPPVDPRCCHPPRMDS